MASKRPTTAQRLTHLETIVDEQRLLIAHLEELHRMQALPPFFMKYAVDYEGPKYLIRLEQNGWRALLRSVQRTYERW